MLLNNLYEKKTKAMKRLGKDKNLFDRQRKRKENKLYKSPKKTVNLHKWIYHFLNKYTQLNSFRYINVTIRNSPITFSFLFLFVDSFLSDLLHILKQLMRPGFVVAVCTRKVILGNILKQNKMIDWLVNL